MKTRDVLLRETDDLPEEKVREVLDFVLFLKSQGEGGFLEKAAETSLSKLWDTSEEDEAWSNL
ncbi:MAG: DUF2281 domain-containing protein [Spirochaetaceae bacterium]|nr:MAG: DUF2281 domain-containing protein [Spirochaetaceae bacterium]